MTRDTREALAGALARVVRAHEALQDGELWFAEQLLDDLAAQLLDDLAPDGWHTIENEELP